MYRFARFLFKILFTFFIPCKIKGIENIPHEGKVLLVGNHKSNYDSPLVVKAIKRKVHFIAKKELLEGKAKFIFKRLEIIPVDRKNHNNRDSLNKAIEYLNNDEIVAIFPEGTFNNTEYIIRPFKIGACYLASKSDCPIIPFSIKGEYKWFKRKVTITFGKPYYLKDKLDLGKENITLMNKVIDLLK
jgi:1-acyl-sn-glycerol-3-phosphate acyltransferase